MSRQRRHSVHLRYTQHPGTSTTADQQNHELFPARQHPDVAQRPQFNFGLIQTSSIRKISVDVGPAAEKTGHHTYNLRNTIFYQPQCGLRHDQLQELQVLRGLHIQIYVW